MQFSVIACIPTPPLAKSRRGIFLFKVLFVSVSAVVSVNVIIATVSFW